MGYPTKVQRIQRQRRAGGPWYVPLPAVLARTMEFDKSETVEGTIQDKNTLILRRPQAPSPLRRKPP